MYVHGLHFTAAGLALVAVVFARRSHAQEPHAQVFLDRGATRTFERVGWARDRRGRSASRVRVATNDGRAFEALVPPEAIVRLAPDVSAAEAWRELGLRPVRELMRETHTWLVVDTAGRDDGAALSARLVDAVRAGRLVRAAAPDLHVARRAAEFRTPPDDPRYPGQWYLARIGIEAAWRRTPGDPSVSIAVMDNGCDASHPDLRANLRAGRDVIDDDDGPDFVPGERGNNHGTACAGVAAAVGHNALGVAGVCPRCSVRCVRLLGRSGEPVPISVDVAAFAWALREGVAVSSNSWGFARPMPVPGALADAIEALYERGRDGRGALVIFAAGNENREVRDDEIYGVRGVVTVGAVNNFDEATSFSNRGAPLTLSAPTGTVTTDLVGAAGDDPGDYTALFGGTSSACPVVAGVAGLLFSARPELSAAEARVALVTSARRAPFARPDADGHDPFYGHGIVDPAAALRAVLGPEPADAGTHDAAPDARAEVRPDSAGCGCRVTATTPGGSLGLGALALFARRRRHPARVAARTTRFVALALALFVVLVGCRPKPAATPATATREVTDARGQRVQVGDTARVVTAGGAVTEVVFALGEGARVTGVDSSSAWPAEAAQKPQVGYLRALSAEGLLALRPTLVVTTTEAGPPAVLQQVRGAGVPVLEVPAEPGVEGARARIRMIARAFGRESEGRRLLDALDRDLAQVPPPHEPRPRVVFLYARGAGTNNVAGRATAADAMIRLAGGQNAVDGYEGYRPLTAEALVAAAPDVLLLTTRGLESLGGRAAILALPGVAATPAGRAGRVVALDDLLLLGFGPRTGVAARELAQRLREGAQ